MRLGLICKRTMKRGSVEEVILVGLGANLGDPKEACLAALQALEAHPDIRVIQRSHWYKTAPVPISDQPWYVNGVASIETTLNGEDLLKVLHEIEARFGRVRFERNEARVLDLDLLAYNERVSEGPELVLPHPRLSKRAFVLFPLNDFAPDWCHPVSGKPVRRMLKELPSGQKIELLED